MLSSTLFKQHQCKWHEFVMPPPNHYHASCYLRTLSAFSSSSLNTLSRWLSLSYSYWSSFSSSLLFCWSSGTANNVVSMFTFSLISNCRQVWSYPGKMMVERCTGSVCDAEYSSSNRTRYLNTVFAMMAKGNIWANNWLPSQYGWKNSKLLYLLWLKRKIVGYGAFDPPRLGMCSV